MWSDCGRVAWEFNRRPGKRQFRSAELLEFLDGPPSVLCSLVRSDFDSNHSDIRRSCTTRDVRVIIDAFVILLL